MVHFYKTATILERNDGLVQQVYPVNIESLHALLGNIPRSTGILPEHVIAMGRHDGRDLIIKYVPPKRRNLITTESNKPKPISIVTPPLVWSGCGTVYRIYALNSTAWPNENTMLYHSPFPNVYSNGTICWGDTGNALQAANRTIDTMLDRFFTSVFASHLNNSRSRSNPGSVVKFWETITNDDAYPLGDLLPANIRLIELLEGEGYANTR
ncbi:hypothetical protein SE18_08715 [Herpetosiphon geysericola]|uniref:PRTRC system protein B n=1 Tax=Herpetosiphon geysericola TaxID=70996 RepID=A0A0P6YA34_9CHLR|nr:hypothetical protein SE18_08715 [Herpetosiphon geysericola]